ncbi:MAG: methylated-DNA--[protein]-cysteine S-methyltransferase [Christensenellaceae bacterium]|nr:methylated-DNA--[protein]-cysteine S-methyltransferase [Christensenellaceae bacterium]
METYFTTFTWDGEPLYLCEEGGQITHLGFGANPPVEAVAAQTPLLQEACAQLQAYFSGARKVFDLPLAPRGTAFQRAVWDGLLRIPYGETVAYGQLAASLGRPNAARAVGGACGKNPIAIVIPCHRVVGANGALTGFGGGLAWKTRLLDVEKNR